MSKFTRLMVYVLPVTILSFSLNIPKFLEITVTGNDREIGNSIMNPNSFISIEYNGTSVADPSQTRKDPTFIFWYTISLIWHPTMTTGLIFIYFIFTFISFYIHG